MKNDIPGILSHHGISDPNLLKYLFNHITIKFHPKISLALWNQSLPTACGGQFFVAHRKCVFLMMPVELVLKN